MTKEHPLIFSTPMVQAILEGRKSMTRRIIKPRTGCGLFQVSIAQFEPNYYGFYHDKSVQSLDEDERAVSDVRCPFGEIGEIFWVKETFGRTMDEDLVNKADNAHWHKK